MTIANGETSEVTIVYALAAGGPGSSTLVVDSGEPMTFVLLTENTAGGVYSATYSVTPQGDPASVTALTPGLTVLNPSCTDAGNTLTSAQTLRTLNVHRESPFKNLTGIQAVIVQADHPARNNQLGPGMLALGTTTIVSGTEVDQEKYLAVPDEWESLLNFGIGAGQLPFQFLNPFENPGLFSTADFHGRPFASEVLVGIPAGWRVFRWEERMRTDVGKYLVYYCRDGSTATPIGGNIDAGDVNIVYFSAGMEHNYIYDNDALLAGDIIDGHKGFLIDFVGQVPTLATVPPPIPR